MIHAQPVPLRPVLCLLRQTQALLPVFKGFALLLQYMSSLPLRMFELGELVGVVLLTN
ncbi:hypothetical protein D3C80_2202590 [compost metagenome]